MFRYINGKKPKSIEFLFGELEAYMKILKIEKFLSYEDIISIEARRYCLAHCALEIFTLYTSYFFNFFNEINFKNAIVCLKKIY